ncbi:hypothetical protein K493DRAFT_303095 [Basidiobolus meristosporus CBS 931.73]|uniref:Uncharacterized protein n=1 Tax=Basidiobolus meristosporus CBS 931.73 TaxID=1314790 RepID=A0A1Y1Y4B9_9FUNG|nr:hypothetical protein K493DRAFT_303095 [Basidiobolus meristosporus CBS 931.73]|eukprot:ORX92809.1 hypothetical protein K493DRAFT_303095 [Basidiobolus meristosporus CBS 931.73]
MSKGQAMQPSGTISPRSGYYHMIERSEEAENSHATNSIQEAPCPPTNQLDLYKPETDAITAVEPSEDFLSKDEGSSKIFLEGLDKRWTFSGLDSLYFSCCLPYFGYFSANEIQALQRHIKVNFSGLIKNKTAPCDFDCIRDSYRRNSATIRYSSKPSFLLSLKTHIALNSEGIGTIEAGKIILD